MSNQEIIDSNGASSTSSEISEQSNVPNGNQDRTPPLPPATAKSEAPVVELKESVMADLTSKVLESFQSIPPTVNKGSTDPPPSLEVVFSFNLMRREIGLVTGVAIPFSAGWFSKFSSYVPSEVTPLSLVANIALPWKSLILNTQLTVRKRPIVLNVVEKPKEEKKEATGNGNQSSGSANGNESTGVSLSLGIDIFVRSILVLKKFCCDYYMLSMLG